MLSIIPIVALQSIFLLSSRAPTSAEPGDLPDKTDNIAEAARARGYDSPTPAATGPGGTAPRRADHPQNHPEHVGI